MLRKAVVGGKPSSGRDIPKRKRGDIASQAPLGSKKPKEDSEKELESLVLGGEEQILDALDKSLQADRKDKELTKKVTKTKRPAWQDEDDGMGSIQFSSDRKFTGLKREEESKIAKKDYNQRLQSQFEKVSSAPNWAKLPSERQKNSDDEDSDVEDLLQKTGSYLTSSSSLTKGILQIKPCTDINKEDPLKGKVKALEFHPSAQVCLIGGMNNTLSLFQVDGKSNPKIQSFFMENFPVHTAHFTRDGEQVVMGSKHKSFKYLDMIAGKICNVPVKGTEENCMMHFEVSPDGKYLVFLGKYGRMHFISSKSKELLFTLSMNGNVSSIAFTSDASQMYSFGDEGQAYVWDLKTRDCIHRFMDEGCTQGTTIAVSSNNQYLACGSNTGVVNLYERETCVAKFEPKPLKAILNLTSCCTVAKFNPTSEILAISSTEDEKAIKLVHVASQTVFSNFPDNYDKNITFVSTHDFSTNSGYFGLGTHKGKALLYRLKHYGNY